MKTSKRGQKLIKDFEGLELLPYKDAVGIWTVGYGHTSDSFYKVVPGQKITKAFAEKLFVHDVEEAETYLDRLLGNVELNGNQYGAVISLMFNIGNGKFGQSTLAKKLRRGDLQGASKEFSKWRKGKVNGKLVTLNGLVRRRAAEQELFNTPDYLGDKPVKTPVIEGASEDTVQARETKGDVAAEKPSLWKKLLLPFGGAAGYGASEDFNVFDLVDRAKDTVYGVPYWVIGAGLLAGVGYLVYRHFAKVD